MKLCRPLSNSGLFEHAITVVILLSTVVMAGETSRSVMDRYGVWLPIINWVIQGIFVSEIAVRVIAHASKYGHFFLNGKKRGGIEALVCFDRRR